MQFETLREQMLRAGVAPRRVRRYQAELNNHLADLIEQERASGYDHDEAVLRARALLGSDVELAEGWLDEPKLKSVTARAPWLMFGVLPVLALLGTTSIIVSSTMRIALASPQNHHGLIAFVSIICGYLIGPFVAVTCIIMARRQRLRSYWVWVGSVLIAIFSGFLGLHGGGQHPYSVISFVYISGHISLAATLGVAALRAIVLLTIAALSYQALKVFQPSSIE